MRQNITEKCSELNIPSELSSKIIADIFGSKLGDVFVEGLVDASHDDD